MFRYIPFISFPTSVFDNSNNALFIIIVMRYTSRRICIHNHYVCFVIPSHYPNHYHFLSSSYISEIIDTFQQNFKGKKDTPGSITKPLFKQNQRVAQGFDHQQNLSKKSGFKSLTNSPLLQADSRDNRCR